MPQISRDQIVKIEFWPVDIPITDPFVVATGARVVAENIFVRLTLHDGTQGYGESAPFPEVGGETRDSCLTILRQLAATLIGASAGHYALLASEMALAAPSHPAARCGLETAMID
ncbi:MAG TPA: dipeptide epimerase, partial [Nitrospira sp.]